MDMFPSESHTDSGAPVSEQKQALRRRIRAERRARQSPLTSGSSLSAHLSRSAASHSQDAVGFCDAVRKAVELWGRSQPVLQALFFLPMPSEPPVLPALAWLHSQGVEVLVPRIHGERELQWASWEPEAALEESAISGILEPAGPARSPSEAAVLFLPALALGCDGTRLGQGGGFYDAFLASSEAPRRQAAVVFFQELLSDPVPAQEWDAQVDMAVTETGLWCLRTPPRDPEGLASSSDSDSYPRTRGWVRLS